MIRTTSRPVAPRGRSRILESSVAAALSMGLLLSLGPLLDHAGLQGTPTAAGATGPHLVATAAEIARLPTSGTAWTNLKKAADENAGRPDISNQDSSNDVLVLAKALVFARTRIAAYRSAVLSNLKAVVGTEAGGRSLAAGRGVPAYVIAADLISLSAVDPTFDTRTFRPWLRKLLTEDLQGDTIVSTQETRPNNWGTHAGAARAAIAAYLGDRAQLRRTAVVFKGWLGDRAAYAGFKYGDLSWQCNAAQPVGIVPAGCTKNSVAIDGALPDDMRRGGGFQWPPAATGYPWEAMQGAVLEAELLQRAGYPAWSWQNRALLRAAKFLYYRASWPADSNDDWQPWLLDYRYGTHFRTSAKTHPGKNFGWTDWLYGPRGASSNGWRAYSDSSGLVTYRRAWFRTRSNRHLGGWIHSSRRLGARATFTFYGDQVIWLGPKGPAYGRATIYVDGRRVGTVDLHRPVRHYRVRLYRATFAKNGTHTLTVIGSGTRGHPLVSVDGYLVHRS